MSGIHVCQIPNVLHDECAKVHPHAVYSRNALHALHSASKTNYLSIDRDPQVHQDESSMPTSSFMPHGTKFCLPP